MTYIAHENDLKKFFPTPKNNIKNPSIDLRNKILSSISINDSLELKDKLLCKFKYYKTNDKNLAKIIYKIIPHSSTKKRYYSLVNKK